MHTCVHTVTVLRVVWANIRSFFSCPFVLISAFRLQVAPANGAGADQLNGTAYVVDVLLLHLTIQSQRPTIPCRPKMPPHSRASRRQSPSPVMEVVTRMNEQLPPVQQRRCQRQRPPQQHCNARRLHQVTPTLHNNDERRRSHQRCDPLISGFTHT